MLRHELRLAPVMAAVLPVIDQVFKRYAPRTRVEFTAGKEWFHHGRWSLHHSGHALDIRTRTLPDHGVGALSARIAKVLQETLDARLGPKRYRVLYNDQGPTKPHIHIQFNKGARMSEPGDWEAGDRSNLA